MAGGLRRERERERDSASSQPRQIKVLPEAALTLNPSRVASLCSSVVGLCTAHLVADASSLGDWSNRFQRSAH